MDQSARNSLARAAFGVLDGIASIQHYAYLAVLAGDNVAAHVLIDLFGEDTCRQSSTIVGRFIPHLADLQALLDRDRDELALLYQEPVMVGGSAANSFSEAIYKHAFYIYASIAIHAKDGESIWVVNRDLDIGGVADRWKRIALQLRSALPELDVESLGCLLEREFALLRNAAPKLPRAGAKATLKGRQASILRDMRSGMGTNDIADKYGMSAGAVRKFRSRHKDRLG